MVAFHAMMVSHMIAGAREREALVRDDRDRCELLHRVARALRESVLGYCLMDTHFHVVAEGPPDPLERALRAYVRWFDRRHGRRGGLRRGPVEAFPKRGSIELVRAIRYVHANPLKTQPPLVGRALEFPWSGEREYVGLSCAGVVALRRVRALVGGVPALSPAPSLAAAEPRRGPTAAPGALVAAAAQAYGVDPAALAGPARFGHVAAARALAVAVCVREGFEHAAIAPFLGRSRQQVGRIAARGAPAGAIRIARTLVADPDLRARLPALEVPAAVPRPFAGTGLVVRSAHA